MKTRVRKTGIEIVVRSIYTLVMARCLVLKAAEILQKIDDQSNSEGDNAIIGLLNHFEPNCYLVAADLAMTETFGREGKARQFAYKALQEMLKGDIPGIMHE